MKVILNRDVPNLGEEGDICEVARGYARNYLIPRNMVLMHNRQNTAVIEGRRTAIEQRKAEKRKEASSIKERIESEEFVVRMAAGERGKLFGSVTTATIVEELEKRGIQVERRRVDIAEGTIKSLGTHTVRIRLYGDEEASLTVRVESETPEPEVAAGTAAVQKAKQSPVAAEATATATDAESAAEASGDVAEQAAESQEAEGEQSAQETETETDAGEAAAAEAASVAADAAETEDQSSTDDAAEQQDDNSKA